MISSKAYRNFFGLSRNFGCVSPFVSSKQWMIHNAHAPNIAREYNLLEEQFRKYSNTFYGSRTRDHKTTTANGCKRRITRKEHKQLQLLMTEKLGMKLSLSDDACELLRNHANKLARCIAKPEALYIIQRKTAETVFQKMSPKLLQGKAMFFEVNPGPGVFTKVLLDSGLSRFRVFEKHAEFIPYQEALQKIHNPQMDIIMEDFLTLGSLAKKDDLTDLRTVDSMFKGVKVAEWKDVPPLQIFAILPQGVERRFMSYLTHAFQSFQSPFNFGRTELFLFVSGKEYGYLISTPHNSFHQYRSYSVLCQTIFDIELLHVEPRDSFFPPSTETKGQKWYDRKNMYLLRISPKKFLFDLMPPAMLPEFIFFIQHHLTKRARLIIPSLEEWLPGSGFHFVKEGLHVHAKFGELSPQQLFTLFLHFSSMPEYLDCLFRTAAKANDISISNLEQDEIEDDDLEMKLV